ncbi:MAG: tRNA pseudouridine(55) synthase TruB [Lachnospiraceae bacterium]|nr:tRNA pseudouridine(55) synthase TruB [Lachnospiraceae bacterium]
MDGIINVYKEKGFTSHDVVAKLRGILRQKKIGHTGTLDPDAEGVLPVCLGRATKVCELLTDWDKEYRAVLQLGRTTDTQDGTGTVLRECPVFCVSDSSDFSDSDVPGFWLTEDEIRDCIGSFVGEQQQIPPMYSALKVNGKKLYELARQGIEVERKPRTITISEIRVERMDMERDGTCSTCDFDLQGITDRSGTRIRPDQLRTLGFPEITMTVRCSKGTYIRTLCNDIGEKLGCGGCMKDLVRTQVGPFSLAESRKLSDIERLRDENRLEEILHPVDAVFGNLDRLVLTPEAERLVRNGNSLTPETVKKCVRQSHDDIRTLRREKFSEASYGCSGSCSGDSADKKQIRIYAGNGEFLAVYGYNEDRNNWRAVKMFLP